jgi:membrane fusion protein (multidrug efflux system)
LDKGNVVAQNEAALLQIKVARARARAKRAEAELNLTRITAPFDGIIDCLHEQPGGRIKVGDVLATLSDSSLMWVYFNVPEADYLEQVASPSQDKENQHVELVLANGTKFPQRGKLGALATRFDNETGYIRFRAAFPNPDRVLSHGMTGTVLIHRTLKNGIVIPQQAAFDTLGKRYVYVVDKDNIVHRRGIVVQCELKNLFVIKSGVGVNDRIVCEGVRQLRDGDLVNYEFCPPE